METTRYFERTLFYDRSPAANEYYERAADTIFEKDSSKTRIAVLIQSFNDIAECEATNNNDGLQLSVSSERLNVCEEDKSLVVPQELSQTRSNVQLMANGSNYFTYVKASASRNSGTPDEEDACSEFSRASSTALPSGVDQLQANSVPPLYPGVPKLTCIDVLPSNIESFAERTKKDFRVFYLRQRHSHSRLQITKRDFESLLESCHVFPRFNEFVIGFGSKNSESEVGPPPLKFRPIYKSLDNLYRGFECAYILRYIEKTNRPGGRNPWSLRQFAVYHRFKPAHRSRCSTWILVGASKRTELRLDQYTRSVDDLMEANPYELHAIFLDTVIASWRPYIVHLTQMVSIQSSKASGVSIGGRDFKEDPVSISVEDHQQLKEIEDNVADLILCLDATLDTLTTFKDMYEQHVDRQIAFKSYQQAQPVSNHTSDAMAVALKEMAREMVYTRKKVESLLSKVQNTRTLISSLLERQSGHNIDQQIAALHNLERQGQEENKNMKDLAEKTSRDSSSMRILTIITMTYLPCTIVSNFYSTQFVNQIELDGGTTRLGYAQNAWLFFAISVPLTMLTFLVWYSWVHAGRMHRVLAHRLFRDGKAELPQ